MKESNICPKCKSSDVVCLPTTKLNTINIIQLNDWGTHYGYFDRYVCVSCGFMEQYVQIDKTSWRKWIEKMQKDRSLDSDFV